MHNRRLGALIIGAWLVGTVLVWFVSSQSITIANNLAVSPPSHVQKELAEMGSEAAGNLLRHQAKEITRHVRETWEMLQIGLAAALFVTSLMTMHRTSTVLVASVVLAVLSCVNAFYLTPSMTSLGRSLDFLPLTMAAREREMYNSLQIWHRVVAILQLMVASVAAVRLLFDFYEFREAVSMSHRHRHGRSQRNGSSATGSQRARTSEVFNSKTTGSGHREAGAAPN